jgi:hypothetical protein
MWEQLLRGLREIEEAEETAAAFRSRYAKDAEAQCDEMIAALPAKDPRRTTIQMVRRALRWAPVKSTQAFGE